MILEGIIVAALNALEWVISLLPDADGTVLTALNNLDTTLDGYTGNLNWLFPINTALTILRIVVAIEVTFMSIRLLLWILSIATGGIVKKH